MQAAWLQKDVYSHLLHTIENSVSNLVVEPNMVTLLKTEGRVIFFY